MLPPSVMIGKAGTMYQRHFGFKERPFRLVPDPAYLFLGKTHQEALAHLTYAVKAGDGFVAVIGEVGTGKTTLCRAFLESLDKNVTSAYIFNPAADPVDLIRSINRDFDLPAGTGDLQDLIESLNRFLMAEKEEGRTVVMVIDEAQNLSRHVLEQIRLLSNLETARNKLLQIIIVGQPELRQTLAAKELRQLRQRITINCRLLPLSLAETGAYIRHRLAVATTQSPVGFSAAAVRTVFRFSGGIPRLINTVCDRALLTAYDQSLEDIDGTVARQAVRELQSADAVPRTSVWPRGLLAVGLGAAAIATTAIVGLNTREPIPKSLPPAVLPTVDPTPIGPQGSGAGMAAPPARAGLGEVDNPGPWVMKRSQALTTLLNRWTLSPAAVEKTDDDDLTFLQKNARSRGLMVYRIEDRPDLIEALDLPALLSVSDAGQAGYGVLIGRTAGHYILAGRTGNDIGHFMSPRELNRRWTGTAYVLWKDFYGMAGEMPGKASPETVQTLKRLLREFGYDQVGPGTAFDEATRRAVIDFQTRHGLPADGVVGSLTKIALYNTRPEMDIPRLKTAPKKDDRQPGKRL